MRIRQLRPERKSFDRTSLVVAKVKRKTVDSADRFRKRGLERGKKKAL